MKISIVTMTIFGVLVSSLIGATTTQAADAKHLTAASCTSSSSSFTIDTRGNALNTGLNDITINCPIIRDSVYGNLEFSRVYIQDRHPSRNARCILYNRHPSYSTTRTFTNPGWEYTSGYGSTSKTLNLGWFSGRYPGGYYVQCVIPGRYGYDYSGITGIYYGEN